MANAVYDSVAVEIAAEDHSFRASSSSMKFSGYTAVYEEGRDEEKEEKESEPQGVGTHISDKAHGALALNVNALVKLLGDGHGAPGGHGEFPGGLLRYPPQQRELDAGEREKGSHR